MRKPETDGEEGGLVRREQTVSACGMQSIMSALRASGLLFSVSFSSAAPFFFFSFTRSAVCIACHGSC